MEVCRPMPFVSEDKPRVTGIIKRSLTGLFGKS
jgi:putative membrane protein